MSDTKVVSTVNFVKKVSSHSAKNAVVTVVYQGYETMADDCKPVTIDELVYDANKAPDNVRDFLFNYGVKQFIGDGGAISRTDAEKKAGKVITPLMRHEGRVASIRLLESGKTKKATAKTAKISRSTVLLGIINTGKLLTEKGTAPEVIAISINSMLESNGFTIEEFDKMVTEQE